MSSEQVLPSSVPQELPLRGRTIRVSGFSARVDTRSFLVSLALAAATFAVGCWSISVGDFPIPLSDVLRHLIGRGSDDADFIVGTLRLPRTLTGILVGATFGMAGAIFQSLARNPLGSPDIIGFNSGSAVGAVFVIVVLHGSSLQVALGAIAGGLGTASLVFILAWQNGVRAYRLVLVGIGIGFAASAVVQFLMTRAEIFDVQRAAVWLTGSLNARTWTDVQTVGFALLVLGPAAIAMQRWLDRLELGDDTAAAIGIPVNKAKLGLIVVGVCLAALGVAAAGPIGFVSFVSGPVARRLTQSPGAAIVPAAFVGAFVTIVADLAARRAFAPTELPVGIATAIIGAPYLLWLLARQGQNGAL